MPHRACLAAMPVQPSEHSYDLSIGVDSFNERPLSATCGTAAGPGPAIHGFTLAGVVWSISQQQERDRPAGCDLAPSGTIIAATRIALPLSRHRHEAPKLTVFSACRRRGMRALWLRQRPAKWRRRGRHPSQGLLIWQTRRESIWSRAQSVGGFLAR